MSVANMPTTMHAKSVTSLRGDSTIWGTSSPALRPDEYFSSNQYQAGDSGFPLGMRMLTPYRLPYSSASGNDAFNTGHASLRVVCEHGNGILKGRWSSLSCLPVFIRRPSDVKTVCNWILACCILHNVVNRLRNGEDTVPLFVEEVRPNTECKSDVVDGCLIWRENIKSEL
ncbi:hypothetical protein H257_14252 [Aphanomyces astaci]|uniref:DDE Tnp4 domain-containing protein n=1 Tax=Aphanomyces astaci TaxID=112090 RepID=W4FU87_APHAT|nr:hypothetical protein H257_14252 [Aphanomyces astaci]ETV70223.1 hypothetical protein H257_14252 [Aphanomyces astaci]|eukprot:XP_009840319.1 hypothetical protein H257_14252 [Aphanomyces astaci]